MRLRVRIRVRVRVRVRLRVRVRVRVRVRDDGVGHPRHGEGTLGADELDQPPRRADQHLGARLVRASA